MARATKRMPAQELTDLADSLTDAANGISATVNTTLDPLSPQGRHLLDISAHIADNARNVRALALASLAPEVGAAVADLTQRIRTATDAIATIQAITRVLSVAAAILSIAAAVATKDPFGAVDGVTSLVKIIDGATEGVA